jgi:hypothetical protein
LVSQLAAPRSVQTWAGSGAPVATFVHDPIVPDSAHDRQALVQAVAQHTPCAQLPEIHSKPSEQNAPLGFLPQELLLQTLPGEQFASSVQPPKHCAPLQANGTHEMVTGATHAPVALQVDSGVNTLLSQCGAAQTVPGRWRRQAPAPSQVPSVPQVSGGWDAQLPRGSSAPAATCVQTPGAEGSAQLRQPPVQASAQQTPSMQKFDWQSPALPHGWPLGFLPQLPLLHTVPATQSSLLMQRLMQALSAQRNGSQLCTPGIRQLPRPLQVPEVFSRSPAHDGITHTVSAR